MSNYFSPVSYINWLLRLDLRAATTVCVLSGVVVFADKFIFENLHPVIVGCFELVFIGSFAIILMAQIDRFWIKISVFSGG
jgi:hypothetical protein